MKYYAHYGHRDFIVCLGYHGDVIRRFFNEEEGLSGCRVTYVDTGIDANVGQRLRAVRSYVEGEPAFLANYSDGLTDLDLPAYLDRFRRANKIASLLCVRPPSTLHVVFRDVHGVVSNVRRLADAGLWINGGFFAFTPAIFDYIREGEDLVEAPFERLIRERQLIAYRSKGFWACMDTFKDKQALEAMYHHGLAPWEVWRRPDATSPARLATSDARA
jgi:glucose-1-phosphate cytidylyltransferase